MGCADAAEPSAASAGPLALMRLGRSLVMCALVLPAVARAAALPDTSTWHAELGGAVDGTNEIFYQGAFVDTVFLPRQLVSEPEVRVAAVGLASRSGSCGGRSGSYLLQGTGQYGDKVKGGGWLATWRQSVSPPWRLGLDQRFDYRDDRSFGRLTREWLGSFRGEAVRRFLSSGSQIALANAVAYENVLSDTTGFLLTNLHDRTSLSVEGVDLFNHEWEVTSVFGARVFRDSVSRDQNELDGTARWQQYHGSRGATELELGVTRRWPQHDVATTRDRFLLASMLVQSRLRFGTRWTSIAQVEFNETRYDEPDDVFFDYSIARATLGIQMEPDWRLSITAAPRVEWLRAPSMPPEEYLEGALGVDASWIRPGAYLSLVPAAGYRDYSGGSSIDAFAVEHSSYAFYEASAYVDHALWAALRVRGAGSVRWERHTNSDDDLTSLYFSLDLRRIF